MKKIIFVMLCLAISLAAVAEAPRLNVEKLFDGSYNADKSVTIHLSKSKGKYYRGFTVTNNAKLVKTVTDLVKKDSETAEESQEIIEQGKVSFSSLSVKNNGMTILVGLSFSPNNSCYLYITGPIEAFK